jgi:hypothetical protein
VKPKERGNCVQPWCAINGLREMQPPYATSLCNTTQNRVSNMLMELSRQTEPVTILTSCVHLMHKPCHIRPADTQTAAQTMHHCTDPKASHTCHVESVEGHLRGGLPYTLGSQHPNSLTGGCQAPHVFQLHQPLETCFRGWVQ